jgi:uncharacterized delta-60 repeat protein
VAGKFCEGIASSDVGTVRYNADGTLDATFGNGGIVDTLFAGQNSEATQVAVQANGDVVVVGDADADGRTFNAVIVRYTPNGQLDATFGNGGQVLTNTHMDLFAGVHLALQADGKILLGTSPWADAAGADEIVLARYNGDGGVDVSFGNGGQVDTTLGQYNVFLTDMALEPDGKIVKAGSSFSGPFNNPDEFGKVGPFLTLARFQNDSLPLVLNPPPAAPPQTPDNSASGLPAQAPLVSFTPPTVVPNSLEFTQGASPVQSTVIPQSQALLVVPSPAASSAVVSGPSNADPFGIHLVRGSDLGNIDATTKWDNFPVLMPDSLMGDAATGVAVLPFITAADDAGASLTLVIDAFFQQLPFWPKTESASVGVADPSTAALIGFPVKGNPTALPLVKGEAGARRWHSLAAGVLLSAGLTAAAADEHRRRTLAHFKEPRTE